MSHEIEEIGEDEFAEIQAEKRHKALLKAISSIATGMPKNDDSKVIAAIQGQAEGINQLVKAVAKKTDVNVQFDHKEFEASIQKICDKIVQSNNEVISVLENRLLPDTFDLIKSYDGLTRSVKVNYKTARQLK